MEAAQDKVLGFNDDAALQGFKSLSFQVWFPFCFLFHSVDISSLDVYLGAGPLLLDPAALLLCLGVRIAPRIHLHRAQVSLSSKFTQNQ